ncbi:hypothetical protein [Fulvimarina manganoxydans]|uniref:hypothetical protein n=1 Tax=Fulvimarina manganoxydans TaxID=937218 RepID=UPI001482E885|nr:hypothetical protein [Fulvimarina manganoxydans]
MFRREGLTGLILQADLEEHLAAADTVWVPYEVRRSVGDEWRRRIQGLAPLEGCHEHSEYRSGAGPKYVSEMHLPLGWSGRRVPLGIRHSVDEDFLGALDRSKVDTDLLAAADTVYHGRSFARIAVDRWVKCEIAPAGKLLRIADLNRGFVELKAARSKAPLASEELECGNVGLAHHVSFLGVPENEDLTPKALHIDHHMDRFTRLDDRHRILQCWDMKR